MNLSDIGEGLAAFARENGQLYGLGQVQIWLGLALLPGRWRRRSVPGPLWGTARPADRPLDLIAQYHRAHRSPESLDPQTCRDLDLDKVFRRLDHTGSATGQQVLYRTLHTPSGSAESLEDLDGLAERFTASPSLRTAVRRALYRLDDTSALHLPRLFSQAALPQAGPYRWLLPLLTLAFLLSLAAPLLWGGLSFFVPLTLAVVNLVCSALLRPRFNDLIPACKNLRHLIGAAERLATLRDLPAAEIHRLATDCRRLSRLKRLSAYLAFDNPFNEVVSSAILYLNTFLLLDLNACVFSLGELTRRRDTLHRTFETLGRIDSCLAVASFRAGSAAYCKPDFVPPGKTLSCRDAFHPLLDHPVPQSFDLAGQSLLVYGANMAGKTTFARALALNALLAQTLYTCTAAVYRAPFFRLRTFINRGDDVLEGKSYYMAEVEAVGHMVEAAARRADRPHLFVLDEPFKGTNARERLAASLSVLEYLDEHGHLCIAATHDERLGQALKHQWDICHLQGHMADGELVFDYRLRPGFDYSANAIHLLEAQNYPAGLVRRARALVDGNDKNQGQTDEP